MWDSIEEELLYCSELTPEERLYVDQQVQQRPELSVLLEEVKAFSAMIDVAQQLHATPLTDEALAYFIATQRVSSRPLPDALQEVFQRIDEKRKDDEALQARYAELVRRMTALEAASNPVQQFEQLSGHQLPVPTYDAARLNGGGHGDTEAPHATSSHSGQGSVQSRLWIPGSRRAIAALVFGLVFYGLLALVSHFSQSDLDLIAVLDPTMLQAANSPLRGGEPAADTSSPDALYRQAVSLLQEVRMHTLGLFPRYDTARLREVEGLLERAVDLEAPDAPLRSKANYLLAEVRVAQKNVDRAKQALHVVLNGSGIEAQKAQALLDQLNNLDE